MYGAIVGDIIGSTRERHPVDSMDFELFPKKSRYTDDTILTVAVASALMNDTSYAQEFKRFYKMDPKRGFGRRFREWAKGNDDEPYSSYGNGSAMRVSPVAWFCDTQRFPDEIKKSAIATHNHEEGIKGAEAVAWAIRLARSGKNKDEIKHFINIITYGTYDLERNVEEIRKNYGFRSSCQESVPEAIIAFLESDSYEDAVRKAIYLGGDADTQAAIAGSIAEAFYGGVPSELLNKAYEFMTLTVYDIAEKFHCGYVKDKYLF